jgi:transposase-like protein
MKTCDCGGMWYRNGNSVKGGQRYRCKSCGKSITVVNGKKVEPKDRLVKDWRHASE